MEARILEAITPSRIGGAEVYVSEICRILPLQGVETVLFCPSGRPFVEYAKNAGLMPTTWKTHGKIDPWTVVKLVKLIRSNRCSAVHTHLSTASLLGALAARICNVPSIAHVHGMNSAFSYRFSDKLIAVSEAVREHLSAQGLEKKVHVVYNGVDIERFAPLDMREHRIKHDLAEDAVIFGVFGRLSSEKGQHIAIEAFAKAFKDRNNAYLLIVGDGKDKQLLQEKASNLDIAERVVFTGFIENFESIMAACDVVVVPSLREGFGLSAVNAMAMQKPVIASNVGGLPEIIVDGESGILLDAGEADSLAESMLSLGLNRDLVREYGEAGRKRVIDRFEINRQISAVKDLLLENTQRVV